MAAVNPLNIVGIAGTEAAFADPPRPAILPLTVKGIDMALVVCELDAIIRAHQQAANGKGGACDQALGRSRGGLTTKIHMLADTLGWSVRFIITPGQTGDITQAPDLLEGLTKCMTTTL